MPTKIDLVRSVPCDKCGAQPGDWCWSSPHDAYGPRNGYHVSNCHAARIRRAVAEGVQPTMSGSCTRGEHTMCDGKLLATKPTWKRPPCVCECHATD